MKVNRFAFPLNLQLFADDGDQGNDQQNDNQNNQDNPDNQQNDGDRKPTFDDLLKDKSIQSEFDKRISKALETAKAKWETEYQQKLEEAKTEAEKLAKMNAEQKAEYERQQREEELAKREAEITRRELRASALETLSEKGLPKELADIINYTDAESTKTSLESIEKAFRQAVEDGVNERLKGNPPKGGGGTPEPDNDPFKAKLAKYK